MKGGYGYCKTRNISQISRKSGDLRKFPADLYYLAKVETPLTKNSRKFPVVNLPTSRIREIFLFYSI